MPVNVLVAADAFTGNILTEDRYWFGLTAPYSPILIAAGGQQGPYGAQTWGPFQVGADLWLLLNNSAIFAGMYKSSDNGATWNEVDSANHIPSGVATPFWDGATTVIVAYRIDGSGRQEIRLRNFDLTLGTWGAVYGVGGAPSDCTNLGCVQKRIDGTLFVLYDNSPPAPGPGVSNQIAAIYSQASPGGAWVTTIDVGATARLNPGFGVGDRFIVSQNCSVMDATGTMHVLLHPSSNNFNCYQAVTLANALGSFFTFTDNLQVNSGSPLGHLVIIGVNLVVPAVVHFPAPHARNYATIYVGTPLSAPVFTLLGKPGIDPDDADWIAFGDNTNTPDNVPDLFFDGTTLYAIWPRLDSDVTFNHFAQLRLGQTTNTANPMLGWSDVTIFDVAVNSPPGFTPVLDLAHNPVPNEVQIPSIAAFAAAPAPAPAPRLPNGAFGGAMSKTCSPVVPPMRPKPARLDWSTFQRTVEALRPDDVEEVRYRSCGGTMRN